MARGNSWHDKSAQRAYKIIKYETSNRMKKISVAHYEATKLVPEMIKIMGEIARDPKVDAMARLHAANMIVERADGKVAQKVQIQQMEPPEDNRVIEGEIAQATTDALLLEEAEYWIGSGSDPAEWPEHIRVRFGETLEAAEDQMALEDGSDEATGAENDLG